MRKIFGGIIIIAGFLIAMYVSLWLMLISPILECCAAYDAGTLTGTMIGVTILKCMFSGTVGYLIGGTISKIGSGIAK